MSYPTFTMHPQTCRSWLASDGGVTFTIAIASKPAPTNLCRTRHSPYTHKPVGAGLPAMAAAHSPPLSPASRLLQIYVVPDIHQAPTKPVGAGLPAMAASHSPTQSPASRLLQICVIPNIQHAPTKPVGAGLPAMAASHSPTQSPASRLLQIYVVPDINHSPTNL
jgi:hypothetical protein